MKRVFPLLAGVVLCVGILVAVALAAQQGPIVVPGETPPTPAPQSQTPIPETQHPLKVQVEMVHLYATVRDRHGEIVPNLTKDNFRVFEDGQQQKIAYFNRSANLPLTLAILIDTSGSQQDLLPEEQSAAKRFLKLVLKPTDLALVLSFDTQVNLLADFTSSLGILDSAIDRAKINAPTSGGVITPGTFPTGNKPTGTDFYDAVYLASRDKLSGQSGRKAIIALTDAQDYGSNETEDDAIQAAQLSNVVIQVVLAANPWEYINMGTGYIGGEVAHQMASQTGGVVIRAHTEKQMEKAFNELAQELRSQYVIGYYSTNTARNGMFRKVRIETTPKHYHVLTRSGYYAPMN